MARIAFSAFAAGLLCLAADPTFAADKQFTSQMGRWNINPAETHVPPEGFKAPTEPFEVTKDDGNVIHITNYKATPKGLEVSFPYEGAYDGKDYPGGPGGVTTSYRHITASVFYTETRVPNGTVYSERGYLVNGGTKLRLEGNCVNDTGKLFEYVLVYDKAK